MSGALLALCLAASPAAASDAFAPALAEAEARGWRAAKRITDAAGGVAVSAVIFTDKDEKRDLLNIYALSKGAPLLIYTRPGAAERLELDETLGRTHFPDLLKDGSRTLLYRASLASLGQTTLYILRLSGLKVRQVGAFPEGRVQDADGEGRYAVVSRSQPLGRFFMVRCPSFFAMAQTAEKAEVFAWEGGKFVPAGAKHPAFYAARIARDEEALRGLDAEKARRPGEYFGKALTLYYDYAGKGERKKGWKRFEELVTPPAGAPALVGDCFNTLSQEMRSRLEIPAGW